MKVLVIGATSGIGKALVEEYRRRGHEVIATGRRVERLRKLQAATGCHAAAMDVTELAATRTELERLWDAAGGIDLVIYNAGRGDQTLEWSQELAVHETNATGFLNVASFAYERFRQTGGGQLAAITSMMAIRGGGHSPVYSATKSFVSIYLEGLRYHALRAGERGIWFTEIRPGFVDTEIIQENDPKEMFWIAKPERVAPQIVVSIERKARVAYVTRRWRLIAWIMRWTPAFLYGRLV